MSRLTDPVYLTVKAAAAAGLGTLLAHAARVPDPLSSCFVALVCTTPSAYAGLGRGLEQLGGALVGGAITAAILAALPFHHDDARVAIVVALSLGATTWACLRLRWEGGHITAGFTALYLTLLPFPSFAEASRVRLLAVCLGILAATAVNVAVSLASSRKILARRVRLAREAVAEPLRQTARACAVAEPRAGLADAYGPAFDVVVELRRDLAGLAREVILPSRHAVRVEARARIETAARLEEVAHLGKHIALLLEDADDREPSLARALEIAADAVASARGVDAAARALAAASDESRALATKAAAQRLARVLRAVG